MFEKPLSQTEKFEHVHPLKYIQMEGTLVSTLHNIEKSFLILNNKVNEGKIQTRKLYVWSFQSL